MRPLFALLAALSLAAAGSAPPVTAKAQAAAPAHPTGKGVVRAVDAKARTVTIAHEPIASLDWPAMTMPFKVSDPALLAGLKVGAKVRFQLDGMTIVGLTVL